MSKKTLGALPFLLGNEEHHRIHLVERSKQFSIGEYTIKSFPLVHDVDNLGFLIAHRDEKLLYATDTNYIPYRFKGLTHILLGVDYDADILRENVTVDEIVDLARAKRTLKNHMSIQTAKEFFLANDMSRIQEIHLLHLSDANSNEKRFIEDIQALTGRPVFV